MAYKLIVLDEKKLAAKIAALLLKKKKGEEKLFVSATDLQVELNNKKIFARISEVENALTILCKISQKTDDSLKAEKTGGYWLSGETLMMALANSPKAVRHYLKNIEK